MLSDKTAAAIILVTLIVLVIASSGQRNSSKPAPKPVVEQPLQWSAPDINEHDCISTGSPDEWVRELDEPDMRAVKSVNTDGSVTITQYIDRESTRRWVLYPTRLACLDSISKFRYEVQH